MSDAEFRRPLARRVILNRFVLVPVAIALVVVGWNLWVSTHDDGIVEGRVVDAAGQPVAGATVTLWAFNFTTFAEKGHVTTSEDGRFRFTDNASHAIQVSAEKPGVGRAERVPVRLYFRAQNVALATPLRLSGG